MTWQDLVDKARFEQQILAHNPELGGMLVYKRGMQLLTTQAKLSPPVERLIGLEWQLMCAHCFMKDRLEDITTYMGVAPPPKEPICLAEAAMLASIAAVLKLPEAAETESGTACAIAVFSRWMWFTPASRIAIIGATDTHNSSYATPKKAATQAPKATEPAPDASNSTPGAN